MPFSDIVKQARQTLGVRQEDLAHVLKVSYVTINRWENGKTEPNQMARSVFFEYCQSKGIQIQGEGNKE
ncbi:helix-turn-helix domain-containing protein [Treponema primitia]|uniref:helix-turn-helix domain-containing protein n=1 Tax=Treponema primitia TaxID=88058 RepID=UPI00397F42F7